MYRLGLKIFVSVIALGLVVNQISLGRFLSIIKDIEWSYLYLSLLIYLLAQILCAFKWKILAAPLGIIYPLKKFIAYYFIGMFFNLFLPTSIGGDMGKCYYLAKGKNSWSRAIISVLGERITGVISLLVVLIIGTFYLHHYVPLRKITVSIKPIVMNINLGLWVIILIIIALLALTGLCLVLASTNRLGFLANQTINWVKKSFIPEIIIPFRENPTTVFKAIGLGLVFQLLIILIHILIGYSLALTVPLLYYFILYPIADLISFLPLTFNGIGLREWIYMYLFGLISISQEAALGFSLLWFFILCLASLMGGMVFVLGNFESPHKAL
jgi:hypothetical protein